MWQSHVFTVAHFCCTQHPTHVYQYCMQSSLYNEYTKMFITFTAKTRCFIKIQLINLSECRCPLYLCVTRQQLLAHCQQITPHPAFSCHWQRQLMAELCLFSQRGHLHLKASNFDRRVADAAAVADETRAACDTACSLAPSLLRVEMEHWGELLALTERQQYDLYHMGKRKHEHSLTTE